MSLSDNCWPSLSTLRRIAAIGSLRSTCARARHDGSVGRVLRAAECVCALRFRAMKREGGGRPRLRVPQHDARPA
eukprot:1337737-Prymnesium_polylepis.1